MVLRGQRGLKGSKGVQMVLKWSRVVLGILEVLMVPKVSKGPSLGLNRIYLVSKEFKMGLK